MIGSQSEEYRGILVCNKKARVRKGPRISFVHIFQKCVQDSATVSAIMKNIMSTLKKEIPGLQRVYYKQDNAGCYHSGAAILGSNAISDLTGVTIERIDFSESQAGKGACDRQAATIKAHIRVHLNEGHDVESGR